MTKPLNELQRHLIARHGFNGDTARIWSQQELTDQHDRYHEDETVPHLGHLVTDLTDIPEGV